MANNKFKSDSDGFLVGEPLSLENFTGLWKSIRQDVAEIKELLKAGNQVVSEISKSTKHGLTKSSTTQLRNAENFKETEKVKSIAYGNGSRDRGSSLTATPNLQKNQKDSSEIKRPDGSSSQFVAKNQIVKPASEIKKEARETGSEIANSLGKQKQKEESKGSIKKKEPAAPKNRDEKGRFVSGETSFASDIADKISSGLGNFGDSDLGEADPSIQAAEEIAKPLSRGWELISGSSQTSTNLLKKFYNSFKGFWDSQKKYYRDVSSDIEDIRKNGKDGRSSGSGLFSSLPRMGLPGGIAGLGGKLGKLFLGFSKKIPVIGGLITGLMGLSEIFQSESSDLSREEKNKKIGKVAGETGGVMAGGFLGAKIGASIGSMAGPIGTIVGGIVGSAAGMFFGSEAGSILGQWCADAFNSIINFDYAGVWRTCTAWVETKFTETVENIKGVFSSVGDSIKGKFEEVKKFFEPFKKVIDNLSNWIENNPLFKKAGEIGGQVVETVTELKDDASEFVSNSWESAKESAGNAVNSVKDGFKKLGSFFSSKSDQPETSGKGALSSSSPSNVSYKGLGSISSKYETGGRGVSTISTGKGDYGGASYGAYQLSSKSGTLQRYLKHSGYDKHFEGLRAGTSEFNKKWKELAANDENFGNSQHEFIKATHYDPTLARLNKSGIDLSKRGKAVQEAIFSTSVQYGTGKAHKLVRDSLKGKDLSTLSDADIVAAIQDRKLASVSSDFRSSSRNIQAGVAKRIVREKADLLQLAAADEVSTKFFNSSIASDLAKATGNLSVPTVSAKTGNLTAPTIPTSPKLAKPEPILERLASGSTTGKEAASGGGLNNITQDVRDRQIAHIVTGGIV